jgi:hypothetical protein
MEVKRRRNQEWTIELETKRQMLAEKHAKPSLQPLQQKIEKAKTELGESGGRDKAEDDCADQRQVRSGTEAAIAECEKGQAAGGGIGRNGGDMPENDRGFGEVRNGIDASETDADRCQGGGQTESARGAAAGATED